MATTYTKVLKTINIRTLGGSVITVEDTVKAPVASTALADFEAFRTMQVVGTAQGSENEADYVIPFHAVEAIEVTGEIVQATKADPYGCEEDGETGTTESGGK